MRLAIPLLSLALLLPIAAQANDTPQAEYEQGIKLRNGDGVEKNPNGGLRHIINAAKQKHVPALLEISRINLAGDGVTQSTSEGWAFLLIADKYATGAEKAEVAARKKAARSMLKGDDETVGQKRAADFIKKNFGA